MDYRRLTALFIVVGLVLAASPVRAGAQWTIERNDSDGSRIVEYYAEDFHNYQTGDTGLIFDMDMAVLTVIKPKEKVFASGKAEELRKIRKARETLELERLFVEKVANLPEEEQKELRQAWGEHRKQAERRAAVSNLNIEVNATDLAASIAGYESIKHQIWVNGELAEEWWIAAEVTPMELIDVRLLDKMWAAVEKTGPHPNFIRSVQVRILWRKGYPMKRVRYLGGLVLSSEVFSVRKGDLDQEAYSVPDGLRRVSFGDLLDLTKGNIQ